MATPTTPRGFARRLLARDRLDALDAAVRAQAQRLGDLDARLVDAVARLDGLDATVAQLHRTLSDADPEMTRQVVDALRADVGGLVVSINELLAERSTLSG